MLMEVRQLSSTIIGCDEQKPTSEVPLTIFDRFATNIHIAILYAFSPPTSSNADIVAGLDKTLAYFPTLAGRLSRDLQGRPCVVTGGGAAGVLVVEASVSSELEPLLPLEPSPDLRLLHPPDDDDAGHLLQVQLNRFVCGGLVIGLTAHHRVADGQSMSLFFDLWGKASRGVAVDRIPVIDRSWLRPRQPPKVEFDHFGSDFMPPSPQLKDFTINWSDPIQSEITNIILRYSRDFINNKLKPYLMNYKKDTFTTFEALLGHLWRLITVARDLKYEEETMVRVSVNGRRRLRPPISFEYFGNLVLNAYPKMKAKELRSPSGAAAAATAVKEAVAAVNDNYFKSFIDFGAAHEGEELVPCYDADGVVLSPKLEVDSWLGFGFDAVDFGRIRAMSPTWVPFEGLVMFLPAIGKEEEGGVDVFVTLLRDHAEKMKNISHSLD